jgi:hypothetical protein
MSALREGRSDEAWRCGDGMKDIRCMLGRHDWTTDLPDGAPVIPDQRVMACRRCKSISRHDASAPLPKTPYQQMDSPKHRSHPGGWT